MKKETKQTIQMYQSNDWELDSETETYYLLKKNTDSFGKHVVCFILAGWWTFGLANLIYHLVSSKKKKIFK